MGMLIDGAWNSTARDAPSSSGDFVRKGAQFRHWITPDGTPGPSGEGGFAAEAGRYHLYVSLACPWAHRTLILRALKGLAGMIDVSVVHWFMGDNGWGFAPGPGVVADPIHHARHLHQIYVLADRSYTGRATVPVLFDRTRGVIVNNESSEIIRMFNSAFDGVGAAVGDYYPARLRPAIELVNARVYETLNNGVYKAGFATTQAAYDAAIGPLFETLDWLDATLSSTRYLCGGQVTEADWRLFPTLVRFDAVYAGHFKCDRRRIADYRNLSGYLRELYQWPGVRETVDFTHIRRHYYESHTSINPHGIVPIGPVLALDTPHERGHLAVA